MFLPWLFGFCDFLRYGKWFALFIPQLEQAQQHLISLMFKLFNAAVARLPQCSFDNRLLYGRREFGDRSQVLPPTCDRTREVVHEVAYSIRPAAEMKQEIGSHNTPAKSWSPGNRGVRILNVEHALLNQVNHFTVESCLQPVGHVAYDFLAQMDRLLAD